MFYTSIKIGLLGYVSFISSSLYCQSTIIKNTTYGEITVMIEYADPSICPPVSITIPRRKIKDIDFQQGCCAQKITIFRSGTDQKYIIEIPPADATKTCGRFEIKVYIAIENILTAELHYL